MVLWFRLYRDGHMTRDLTVEGADGLSRTAMVLQALDEACREFDLERPMWLSSTVKEFQLHDCCRFTRDAFMEDIPFDYMEMRVLEE